MVLRPTALGLTKGSRWISISTILSTFFALWFVSGTRHLHWGFFIVPLAFMIVPLAFLIFTITAKLRKKKPLP